MLWISLAALFSVAVPLVRAGLANRRSTLSAALLWAAVAWVAWLVSFVLAALAIPGPARTLRYVAIVLTLCAPIMVLGSRRPGVLAWNFVVLALFITLLLPVAQGWGTPRLETPWLLFVGVCLGFCVLNYLPTRLGVAALVLGGACGWELLALGERVESREWLTGLLAAAGPWLALGMMSRRPVPPRRCDRLWLDFRERFGVVWGQRVREQFNRAADNAALGVVLYWHGVENTAPAPDEAAVEETLHAVLKRFGLID